MRKVKGHATKEDVSEGKVTQADKDGNDKSDKNADQGVQTIGGTGLVKLAKWTAERHARYKSFMARIHKFIAAITIVEKDERENTARIQKTVLGYDPDKAIKSNGTIRKEDPTATLYEKVMMPPPVKGKHKFTHCQSMYEQIHGFLAQRKWAHAHPASDAGGITWAELFILFDTSGGRTTAGQHQKSQAATDRAKKRKSKEKKHLTSDTAAIPKPTYDEEIKQFKAICRYVLSNDVQEEQRKWFRGEVRPQWKRLALLGIEGNQPAIAAYCETTAEEDSKIAEAIIRQKVGANPKTIKVHVDMSRARREATDEQPSDLRSLYKKARIACGATVRWKRIITEHVDTNEAHPDRESEDKAKGPTYVSRLLNCIRCDHPNETSWMQLRAKTGYKAIHCKGCGLQQLSSRNKCQCGIIWHHCTIHRTDPAFHRSKKAQKRTKEEQEKRRLAKDREDAEKGGRQGLAKERPLHRSSKKERLSFGTDVERRRKDLHRGISL